jgi:hypothetical protein
MSDVRMKRYPMPKGLECQSITMRELRGGDEIMAALAADQVMTQDAKKSAMIALQHERREAILLSIVAIDDKPIAQDDVRLIEIRDNWCIRTWTVLGRYYADLCGIPEDELGNCLKAAQFVPSASSPPAASTGK